MQLSNTFWDDLWNSFLKVQGVLLGVGSLLFALLLVFWGDKQTILLDHKAIAGIFVLGILLLIAFLTVLDLLIETARKPKTIEVIQLVPPRVLKVMSSESKPPIFNLITAVKETDRFMQDTVVSIYHAEPLQGSPTEFHLIFLGLGKVSNVQEGVRWISLISGVLDQNELWGRVVANEELALKAIVIKPLILYSEMESAHA